MLRSQTQPGSEALFSPPHLLWSPCSGGNEGVIPSRLLHRKMGTMQLPLQNLAHGKPAKSALWICATQDRYGNFTSRPSSQEKGKNQLSPPAQPLTSPSSLLRAAVTAMGEQVSQYAGPWGRGKGPSQHCLYYDVRKQVLIHRPVYSPKVKTYFF